MPGSLTIADNYNDETGEFVLDYDYDEDGNSTPLIIYLKEESIEQEKFHVDPSKTERIYGLHRFFRRGQKMDGLLPI